MQIDLSPEILLSAYSQGLFPMADNAQSHEINWYCPQMRGQLSISDIHIPRRLKKNLRQMRINGKPYDIRINSDFHHVIKSCALITKNRKETWINDKIINAYHDLHKQGFAHSVECWQNDEMVGGLYGIALGAAFFGESMFSTARDASKIALVHLVARLYHAGFKILDTQFTNDHLTQFGVYELRYEEYMKQLEQALNISCIFNFTDPSESQIITNYLQK